MVKGVHKKVIEVHQPDSAYFEKAIFYLRPGITQLPPELAQAAAREYLQELAISVFAVSLCIMMLMRKENYGQDCSFNTML